MGCVPLMLSQRFHAKGTEGLQKNYKASAQLDDGRNSSMLDLLDSSQKDAPMRVKICGVYVCRFPVCACTDLVGTTNDCRVRCMDGILILMYQRINNNCIKINRVFANMLVSRDQNAGQNREIKIGNRSFENVSQFKYLGTTIKKK
jgi:hypothetical protein